MLLIKWLKGPVVSWSKIFPLNGGDGGGGGGGVESYKRKTGLEKKHKSCYLPDTIIETMLDYNMQMRFEKAGSWKLHQVLKLNPNSHGGGADSARTFSYHQTATTMKELAS